MAFIYPVVLIVVILFSQIKERNIYNPSIIFAGMWLVSGVLSMLNLYYFNTVPDYIYLWVLIGVVCFSLGCFTRNRVKLKLSRIKLFSTRPYNTLNYKFLILFYLFVLIFTTIMALRAIIVLRHGITMQTIRFNYSSPSAGLVIRSAFQYDIEHYIVAPAEFAGVALLPIVMVDDSSLNKRILLIELLLFFVFHIFVTGARSFVFDIVFVIALYLIINRNLLRLFSTLYRKIPKFYFYVIGVGAAVLFIGMTSLRRGGLDNFAHEVYAYFTMCFRLFDTHMKLMLENPDYTYGMTLLHGILRIPLVILKFIGIPYPAAYQKAVDAINANNVFYGVGKGSGNSFVTVFYYMFMDFGYIGIIIGCFVYGYFSQSVYLAMKSYPDKRIQSIYLLVGVGLFLSFTRFHFTAPRYVYAFFLLFVFFKPSIRSQKTIEGLTYETQ